MYAYIDGQVIGSRTALHDALTLELSLPDWYGRNLDALYDCLTDLREETYLVVLHRAALAENLGKSARALERLLADAADENPHLHLILPEE